MVSGQQAGYFVSIPVGRFAYILKVLIGTHVGCLLRKIEEDPFVHGETETKLVPLWKNPLFST